MFSKKAAIQFRTILLTIAIATLTACSTTGTTQPDNEANKVPATDALTEEENTCVAKVVRGDTEESPLSILEAYEKTCTVQSLAEIQEACSIETSEKVLAACRDNKAEKVIDAAKVVSGIAMVALSVFAITDALEKFSEKIVVPALLIVALVAIYL